MNPLEEVFISIEDLAKRYSCSIRHIYRLVAGGNFPPPLKLGKLTRWPLSKVLEHEQVLLNAGAKAG